MRSGSGVYLVGKLRVLVLVLGIRLVSPAEKELGEIEGCVVRKKITVPNDPSMASGKSSILEPRETYKTGWK